VDKNYLLYLINVKEFKTTVIELKDIKTEPIKGFRNPINAKGSNRIL
jgi:hypothetical protein